MAEGNPPLRATSMIGSQYLCLVALVMACGDYSKADQTDDFGTGFPARPAAGLQTNAFRILPRRGACVRTGV
ncbi:MAG: hypothetical protein EHM17_12280 [Verrucomicrobiaceae bacterium]|nr:MAG: hypothetical protein EHM17_12280 [Verrucomicrobiaceae bacterium]